MAHPLNDSVPQGGFTREKGGNLRDHDGCYAKPGAIAATKHYDGDYGVKGPVKPKDMRMGVSGGPKPQPAPPPPKPLKFPSGGVRG